jgi:hypothetical protein
MAEVLGRIASVTTVAKALITAVEAVRTVYQAEKELQKLQVSNWSS